MKKYALVIDALFIVLFVAIGRSAHQHGHSVSGMATTTWPFLTGLLLGWTIVWRRHLDAVSMRSGLLIVGVTVAVGMVLRVVSGQGIAVAFVVVALVFLSLFLVGWRLAARMSHRWR